MVNSTGRAISIKRSPLNGQPNKNCLSFVLSDYGISVWSYWFRYNTGQLLSSLESFLRKPQLVIGHYLYEIQEPSFIRPARLRLPEKRSSNRKSSNRRPPWFPRFSQNVPFSDGKITSVWRPIALLITMSRDRLWSLLKEFCVEDLQVKTVDSFLKVVFQKLEDVPRQIDKLTTFIIMTFYRIEKLANYLKRNLSTCRLLALHVA